MRSKTQLVIGILIVAIGFMVLIRTLTGIHIWGYLWPALLIALGIWMIVRPHTARHFCLFGDIRRHGAWQVCEEELWCVIGDVHLDLSEAAISEGDTHIRLYGLVGGTRITLPPDVGISITAPSLITSARIGDFKQDYLFTPYEFVSGNYATAGRRVHLTIARLVNDLRIN